MGFIQEVYKSEKFQKLLKEKPMCANMLFNNILKEWNITKKTYLQHRDSVRANNKTLKCEGKGVLVATVPSIVMYWLSFELDREPTEKEIKKFLKNHKEFWTVDKL